MDPISTNDPAELFELIVADFAACSRVRYGKLSIDGARMRTMDPYIFRLSSMTERRYLDVFEEIIDEVRRRIDRKEMH